MDLGVVLSDMSNSVEMKDVQFLGEKEVSPDGRVFLGSEFKGESVIVAAKSVGER